MQACFGLASFLSCKTPCTSQKRDNSKALIGRHLAGHPPTESAVGRKKALSDQSDRAAQAFGLGIAGQISHVVMRPFLEVAARLRAAIAG